MQDLHSDHVQVAARGLLRHLTAGDVHPVDYHRLREALTGDPLSTTLSRDRLLELAHAAAGAGQGGQDCATCHKPLTPEEAYVRAADSDRATREAVPLYCVYHAFAATGKGA